MQSETQTLFCNLLRPIVVIVLFSMQLLDSWSLLKLEAHAILLNIITTLSERQVDGMFYSQYDFTQVPFTVYFIKSKFCQQICSLPTLQICWSLFIYPFGTQTASALINS